MSLRIGEVAAQAEVAVDTVRYYERRGLLAKARRRASNYRSFEASAVERIKLIKQLQALGLTLDEIEDMLVAVAERGSGCAQESTRIELALARTEQRLAALLTVRDELRRALQACACGSCELVERVRSSA